MKKLEKLCWYFVFCLFLVLTSSSFSYIVENTVTVLQSSSQEENSNNDKQPKKKYLDPNSCCPYQSQVETAKPYSFYYPYEFEYYYPQTN